MLTQRKDKPQPCQSCRLPDDRERLGGFLRESLKLNENSAMLYRHDVICHDELSDEVWVSSGIRINLRYVP
ncbi:hypothetical protein BDV34DRAFT_202728 [Aspergillus parasiticus]|uniref:Uncharacterized protein n=1 Tax=Aspergillus parasiticus TaxID=5067 RepID=A0A5N6D8B9_ASPPA|nr:hypothetical protein BDV34DRAFT_202728 [Aspergillus parasiticus]